MTISIIAAVAENNAIGKDNKLLWHLKEDLQRFKKLTSGHIIIVGENTYNSLPIKPLPNRTNIVITDNEDFKPTGCYVAHSIKEAIFEANKWQEIDFLPNEIFIIGGAMIYEEFMKYAHMLYITKIHKEFEADRFFPKIDEQWTLISEDLHHSDEENFDYTFQIYKK
jgi:dihydrofolate reductase